MDVISYSHADDAHGKIDVHSANVLNPHSVDKTQLGLSNIDNTSDINKPISIATQTAIDNIDENETTKGMYVHENVIDVSYTIPVGSNAVSAGAVTVADLVTITVSDGSSWVVV